MSVSPPSLSLSRACIEEGRKEGRQQQGDLFISRRRRRRGERPSKEQRSAASCKEYSGSNEPCCVVWDRGPTPILPQSFSVHPFCFHTGGGRELGNERDATRSFAFARQERRKNSETSSRYFRGQSVFWGKTKVSSSIFFPGILPARKTSI